METRVLEELSAIDAVIGGVQHMLPRSTGRVARSVNRRPFRAAYGKTRTRKNGRIVWRQMMALTTMLVVRHARPATARKVGGEV